MAGFISHMERFTVDAGSDGGAGKAGEAMKDTGCLLVGIGMTLFGSGVLPGGLGAVGYATVR